MDQAASDSSDESGDSPVHNHDAYQSLISSQRIDGSFTPSTAIGNKKLLESKLPEAIEGIENSAQLWATVLALAILETKFSARKAEWKLIASKAKKYLKAKGLRDKLSEVLVYAKRML